MQISNAHSVMVLNQTTRTKDKLLMISQFIVNRENYTILVITL